MLLTRNALIMTRAIFKTALSRFRVICGEKETYLNFAKSYNFHRNMLYNVQADSLYSFRNWCALFEDDVEMVCECGRWDGNGGRKEGISGELSLFDGWCSVENTNWDELIVRI